MPTKGIIPASGGSKRNAGGILWLPQALKLYPNRGLVLCNRVSSWDQAGKGKVDLQAKTKAVQDEVEKLAPGKTQRVVEWVREGKLSKLSRKLIEAARYAKRHNCILTAGDLSRFLRAEAFDHITNLEAWPQEEEFALFHERTFDVVCATLAHPLLSEKQRRSHATRRTGKCGRPRTINDEMLEEIAECLGCLLLDCWGRFRWNNHPISEMAQCFGVSRYAIMRALKKPSPTGETWYDRALRTAQERGLLEIQVMENGDVAYRSLIPDRSTY